MDGCSSNNVELTTSYQTKPKKKKYTNLDKIIKKPSEFDEAMKLYGFKEEHKNEKK
jgi:hypothetical protein